MYPGTRFFVSRDSSDPSRPPVPTVPPASDSVHTKDCLSSDRTTVWIFPQAPATATDTIGQAWNESRTFT